MSGNCSMAVGGDVVVMISEVVAVVMAMVSSVHVFGGYSLMRCCVVFGGLLEVMCDIVMCIWVDQVYRGS